MEGKRSRAGESAEVRKVLLDTDACIEVIRGNPKPLEAYSAARFVMSSVTRFEIRAGLKKKRNQKAEARAKEFLETAVTLPFDNAAADAAATVRIDLEEKGTPIGAYDTLLAGHALALRIPILTGNQAEFRRIKGLQILSWRR